MSCCASCGCDNCGCSGTPAGCSCTISTQIKSDPCCAAECNTVTCESLASQITNFTKQFFGEVVKSEVDGQVVWTLPCELETGLPNNPRSVDEGLACYFKRLFEEGIIGLTGPVGPPGANGSDGFNAYTVTLASFIMPSEAAPNVQVITQPNPAILEGLYVFIGNAGWFVVNFAPPSGVLQLSLAEALSSAPPGTLITAGKLVVPAGFPGVSITGPPGPQGPAGPQGAPGAAQTTTNGGYYDATGTDYVLTATSAAVDFSTTMAQVLLPDQGTYIITASAGIIGLPGAVTSDFCELKLRDVTVSDDLDGSVQQHTNINSGRKATLALLPVPYVTSGPNHTVRLYGRFQTAGACAVVAARTSLTFVRIA